MKQAEQPRKKRCAVYTRVSKDERLDSEFNSLDAQREAGEAYILSQKHEGWHLISDHYDDAGESGGTLDRKHFQRLLTDVRAGKIDIVVSYKIDRFSRSISDFMKVIEIFDEHNASFVSVTQSFDTSTAMGRLILNVLLSFAQFEREVIGERIRDKVRASRRRGMHTGGRPILGYDIDGDRKRLIVNETEAAVVRRIFRRYLETGSPLLIAQELNGEGITNKRLVSKAGNVSGGGKWDKVGVGRVLKNPKYLGMTEQDGKFYQGEHTAIVTQEVWDAVQARRKSDKNGISSAARSPSLLGGLITCSHCDRAMSLSCSKKKSKKYRYYRCLGSVKNGTDSCPIGSVGAGDIEAVVMSQVRHLVIAPDFVAQAIKHAREVEVAEVQRLTQEEAAIARELVRLRENTTANGDTAFLIADAEKRRVDVDADLVTLQANPVSERDVQTSLRNLDALWDELFPAEQAKIVQSLVERIVVAEDGLEVALRQNGVQSLIDEISPRRARQGAGGASS